MSENVNPNAFIVANFSILHGSQRISIDIAEQEYLERFNHLLKLPFNAP